MNQLNCADNKKYNIVYLIDGLGWGGAERLMIPILSNINRRRFQPRVCVLQNKDGNPVAAELQKINIPVDTLPIPRLREVGGLKKIINYLQAANANLLHAQLEFATVFGGLAAKWLGIPAAATLHTLPIQKKNLKLRLHDALENFFLRNFFNSVIFVSEETRAAYKRVANIRDDKSCVIYNGIDVNLFMPNRQNRASILRKFDMRPGAIVLITVAVLRELKGIQYMIRAMPAIVSAKPNVYYLIIGSGEHAESLKNEAKKSGVSNHIIFAGTRTDIAELMSTGDLFVLPTLTEALPTVLAEAMASGLPILASQVGGVPEMVQDGINGRLIPPAQPEILAGVTLEMLSDTDVLRQMGSAGRKIAEEKFNIKAQVIELENLYLRLLS
ncbi:MAG: glycosyltransferase family 4 protein [Anaerolineales bacterium]